MDTSWDDIRLFLAVAECDSLSAAARTLRIGQATVSRRIAGLEVALGYPLFSRNVAGVQLTEAGRSMLRSARTMEAGALEWKASARGKADELFGRVRFAAPPGVAVDVLSPFAAALLRSHPGIRLETLSSITHLDLSRGEADIALRTREPREPELLRVASFAAKIGVYASRSYCEALPTRAALHEIQWVGWAPPYEGLPPENWVQKQFEKDSVNEYKPVFVADSFVAQERAVVHGAGAILLPDIQAAFVPEIDRVTLQPELEKRLPCMSVYLVVAKSVWRTPRIRAVVESFIDWLNQYVEEPFYLEARIP